MIRIAIVEDEDESVQELERFLLRYGQERGCEIKSRVFSDGEELVRGYRPEYDIILMDIQLKEMDGMTAAELIRRQDPEVMIIFITNMAQIRHSGLCGGRPGLCAQAGDLLCVLAADGSGV